MPAAQTATAARVPLTRHRVLQAALAYVDAYGLAALSMHKLGGQLGVTGMSLYTHVASKDALLDGVVEAIWSEMTPPPELSGDWPDILRAAAQSVRDGVRRHPNAAPLLASRAVMPRTALEAVAGYHDRLAAVGFTDTQAVEALRVVIGYALGYSLTEMSWQAAGAAPCHAGEDDLTRYRRITAMVPAETPEPLVRLAMSYCGGYDPDLDFDRGLELMLAGLVAQSARRPAGKVSARPIRSTARRRRAGR